MTYPVEVGKRASLYMEGKTYREAGEAVGVSYESVRLWVKAVQPAAGVRALRLKCGLNFSKIRGCDANGSVSCCYHRKRPREKRRSKLW